MIPICKKYLRFLDISEEWSDTNTEYDVSLLLNYWLSDKIASIHGITNIDKIRIDFGDLQRIWDHFNNSLNRKSYYYKFKPETNIFNEEDWEKRKKLYEYYVDYDILFRNAQWFPQKCKEYYDKIKEFSTVYKYFEGKCLPGEYKCPIFFDEFKKKNPVHNLENLECYKQIDKQRTAAGAKPSALGDTSHHSPGSKDGPLAVRGDLGFQGDAASTYSTDSTPGMSYTPFGPWIRKLRGGSTNNINAMDGFSPYTQETGDMFSDDSANFISYQPI
ncbi:Plasmodium vivax Vir protein, putative [Plasmodium vivax]|uniref:Vir protein, putative n=1 Tax=Plasmodium vivax TaxID=5855 RepID=A0A1G4EAT6_PLAVI|nr:Plasmodium vivax Vir protein, putative [Plasmodium vivax]